MCFPNLFTVQEARDHSLKRSFSLGPSQSWVEVGLLPCFALGHRAGSPGAVGTDQGPVSTWGAESSGRACPLWVAQVSEDPSENEVGRGGEGESWALLGACRDQVQRVPPAGHSRVVDKGQPHCGRTWAESWSRRSDKGGPWLN